MQRVGSLVVILALAAVAAIALGRTQDSSRQALQDRYVARSVLAASFAQTYVAQLLEQEGRAASSQLSGEVVAFPAVVQALGFSNALLLDDRGRVLAVHPAKPALLGKAIASTYPHLVAAEAGQQAVSPVVPGAADGRPVVGFAVPFHTAFGRRVFSGAYAIERTPLAAYLKTMVSIAQSRVYLLDERGVLLAAAPTAVVSGTLAEREPAISKVFRSGSSGVVSGQFWVAAPVRGTPWTVVTAIPRSSLLAPLGGSGRDLPWSILAALLAAALLAWHLVFRGFGDHDRLALAYTNLDRTARLDEVTGMLNRRAAGELLTAAHQDALAGAPVPAVLMIDVDHFKRINDTFGHEAGDRALRAVALRLEHALRDNDMLFRWGGDEFLVILPETGAAEAERVATRLLLAVSSVPVHMGPVGDEIAVTISLGVGTSSNSRPAVMVHAADLALYRAKNAGRDQVCVVTTGKPEPTGAPAR